MIPNKGTTASLFKQISTLHNITYLVFSFHIQINIPTKGMVTVPSLSTKVVYDIIPYTQYFSIYYIRFSSVLEVFAFLSWTPCLRLFALRLRLLRFFVNQSFGQTLLPLTLLPFCRFSMNICSLMRNIFAQRLDTDPQTHCIHSYISTIVTRTWDYLKLS